VFEGGVGVEIFWSMIESSCLRRHPAGDE
jgi:hypothetical protein